MPDVTAILTAFRAELVAAELVRRPGDAGELNPCFIEPLNGPPAPGELEDPVEDDELLILSLLHSGDVTPGTGFAAALSRRAVIDLRYRTVGGPRANEALRMANALEAQINARLFQPAYSFGYGFTLGAGEPGALFALEVGIWGAYSRIGYSPATGYDLVEKYLVEIQPV